MAGVAGTVPRHHGAHQRRHVKLVPRHFLFHQGVRSFIYTVLLVAEHLRRRHAFAGTLPQDQLRLLPQSSVLIGLPNELWCIVRSFFRRADWPVQPPNALTYVFESVPVPHARSQYTRAILSTEQAVLSVFNGPHKSRLRPR